VVAMTRMASRFRFEHAPVSVGGTRMDPFPTPQTMKKNERVRSDKLRSDIRSLVDRTERLWRRVDIPS
jgi:hypothetical protein